MRAADLVGRTVCGTYIVEQVIGTGTMGVVLQVRHVRLPKRFAMKVLHAELTEGSEAFLRFRREAEIASSLGHPNIVDVVDWNRLPDETPFLIMEYLRGEDLHTRLLREGTLPLPRALELARQVGSALSAAHKQGVVHRDLKPQNIFLCKEDRGEEEVEVAKVLDFGISKILGDPGGTYTGALRVMGTPLYMAPEQAMGFAANVDGRADQFALAAILYHALSGNRPFEGASVVEIAMKVMSEEPPPLRDLCPGLPESVYQALSRAFSKEREDRYPSIGDFVRALEAGAQDAAPHGSQAPQSSSWSRLPQQQASWSQPPPQPGTGPASWSQPPPQQIADGLPQQTMDEPPVLTSGPLLGKEGPSLIILCCLVVLSALLGFFLVQSVGRRMIEKKRPPPPQEVASPPPVVVRPPVVPPVRLRFAVTPPSAEVFLDGKRVDTSSPVEVPRSEIGLRLEVKAPGRIPQTDTVVPSGDQQIIIHLAPARKRPTFIAPF